MSNDYNGDFVNNAPDRLDFITEDQSYTAVLEESDAVGRLSRLMVGKLAEFMVSVRSLTDRQVDILFLRMKGFTMQQIAEMLGVRKQTIFDSLAATIPKLNGVFQQEPSLKKDFDKSDLGEKQCNTCKRTLPINSFGKFLKSKDGHSRKCKRCKNDYNRQRLAPKKRSPENREA